MAINKVEANGETLIDLTSDTVTADTLVSGRTAHLASGAQVTGTFEPVTGVKGNAESAYRKGNVNLTPANIGAATSEQGAKADSAVQTIQIGGTAQAKTNGTVNLPAYPTKSSLGLGNVGNFKAVSTVSSQGLTDTEKANARTNIGAGTSSFDGNYNSLSNKPTIPAAVAVKGNAETSYRTGNVNITPANLGLGNVNNTSDADKPISTAAQAKFDMQQAQIDSIFTLIPQADINHNGIFRGENLTNDWVENGKIKESLYTRVHSGNFSGLYLGDYFTVSITTDIYTKFTGSSFVSGTTYYTLGGEYPDWDYTATTDTAPTGGKVYFTKQTVTENVDLMIAAFDYYYNVGDKNVDNTSLTNHHLVLIPRNYGFKTTAKMNSTNTTEGSYYNSEMHQFTLPCYAKSLKTVLNNHLLAHRTILPNAINASTPTMAGAGFTGASSDWTWETVELQLMSEPQIYGTTVWSSSAYDVGADYKKLPVFDFINGVHNGRYHYWLRSVVSSTNFAYCSINGYAHNYGASGALCVRPLILFG